MLCKLQYEGHKHHNCGTCQLGREAAAMDKHTGKVTFLHSCHSNLLRLSERHSWMFTPRAKDGQGMGVCQGTDGYLVCGVG